VTLQLSTPALVDGVGALATGLEALLPAALDQVVTSLATPGPPPMWLTPALGAAQALGIQDTAGGFAAHADALKALLQADWLNVFSGSRSAVVTALAGMVNQLGLTPPVTASGSSVTWSFSLGGPDAGTIALTAGWDGKGPVASMSATTVKLANGAVAASLSAGYTGGKMECSTSLSLELPSQLGVTLTPSLNVGVSSTAGAPPQFTVHFVPLATDNAPGPLDIQIAPTPQVPPVGADTALQLIEGWLLPLAGNVVLAAVTPQLGQPTLERRPGERHARVSPDQCGDSSEWCRDAHPGSSAGCAEDRDRRADGTGGERRDFRRPQQHLDAQDR
jgi:hypothetical protein